MFILITFLISQYVTCLYARHYAVRYPPPKYNIVGNILSKSGVNLKILKQLSEALPNHAIEIQVENVPDEVAYSRNYGIKNHWLRQNPRFNQRFPYMVRSGNELDAAPLSTAESTTTTTTTTAATTTVATITETTTPRMNYGRKRPLFMEDLIRALEEFDKKRISEKGNGDISTGDENRNQDMICERKSTTEDGNRPVLVKDLWEFEKNLTCDNNNNDETTSVEEPPAPKPSIQKTVVKDFNDVLKLIKKGVKVQLEVTTPANRRDRLTWFPIKVQKEF